ncbi:hypothetical protein BDR07DRAFT_1375624 [Suillus spraguei]|nr:hypothetical protein BDR07DRAFT_1375624 [Suillus spraguei]
MRLVKRSFIEQHFIARIDKVGNDKIKREVSITFEWGRKNVAMQLVAIVSRQWLMEREPILREVANGEAANNKLQFVSSGMSRATNDSGEDTGQIETYAAEKLSPSRTSSADALVAYQDAFILCGVARLKEHPHRLGVRIISRGIRAWAIYQNFFKGRGAFNCVVQDLAEVFASRYTIPKEKDYEVYSAYKDKESSVAHVLLEGNTAAKKCLALTC